MKRIYVNEEWCLGCRLCEYNCAYANSGISGMAKALKDKKIYPNIHVRETTAFLMPYPAVIAPIRFA